MGPSMISRSNFGTKRWTLAPSPVGMLTSAPCKMITCAEVDEIFQNLCRSCCAEVQSYRSSFTRLVISRLVIYGCTFVIIMTEILWFSTAKRPELFCNACESDGSEEGWNVRANSLFSMIGSITTFVLSSMISQNLSLSALDGLSLEILFLWS